MRHRFARVSAWLLAAASVLLVLLFLANLPFYSGSSVGSRLNWRMEHGRLRVECEPPGRNPESFYIAGNSEGLKFAPDWHVYSAGDWFFNIPLWVPLAACILGSAALFIVTRKQPKPGVCGSCGYDLRGLGAGARCPECGEGGSSKGKVQSTKADG